MLEDDYDGEFRYGVPPMTPLRSMPGAAEQVIYLGTSSKVLSRGLRVSWAVLPARFRAAGPGEPEPGEYEPGLWAGVLPIGSVYGEPQTAAYVPPGTPVSPSVLDVLRRAGQPVSRPASAPR